MIVVIDTNAVLAILGLRHPARVIFDAFLDGKFAWAISTEILLEYEEVVVDRVGRPRFDWFAGILPLIDERRRNVRWVSPTYRFRLIAADPDDD